MSTGRARGRAHSGAGRFAHLPPCLPPPGGRVRAARARGQSGSARAAAAAAEGAPVCPSAPPPSRRPSQQPSSGPPDLPQHRPSGPSFVSTHPWDAPQHRPSSAQTPGTSVQNRPPSANDPRDPPQRRRRLRLRARDAPRPDTQVSGGGSGERSGAGASGARVRWERRGGGREANPAGASRGPREPLFGGGGRVSPASWGLPGVAESSRRVGSEPPEPPPVGARCGAAPCFPPHSLRPGHGVSSRVRWTLRTWKNQPGREEIHLRGVPSVSSGAVGCRPECGIALRPRLWTSPREQVADAPRLRQPGPPRRAVPEHPSAVPEHPSAIPTRRNELYLRVLSTALDFTAAPTLARRTPVGALLLRRLRESIFLSGIFVNVAKTAFAFQKNNPLRRDLR